MGRCAPCTIRRARRRRVARAAAHAGDFARMREAAFMLISALPRAMTTARRARIYSEETGLVTALSSPACAMRLINMFTWRVYPPVV